MEARRGETGVGDGGWVSFILSLPLASPLGRYRFINFRGGKRKKGFVNQSNLQSSAFFCG